MKRLTFATLAALGALLATAAPALAQTGATLFGGATQQAGAVQLVSNTGDASTTNDASGINFTVPTGTTFAQLRTLAAEFNVTDDDCGGGSPRFQINIGGKNVFVYFGPSPNFTGCAQNTWISTGNLIGNNDACRFDTSQLPGGKVCSTYAEALALLGNQVVTGIQLVVDSGWFFADKEQTVLVRNVTINGRTFTGGTTRMNPAQMCRAQRTSMGAAAFNQFWGTNANDRNAFGKCVSAMAKAQREGRAAAVHNGISSAVAACKAEGRRGAALGACVESKTTSLRPGNQRENRGQGGRGRGRGR